jgi:hypothetical protein
MPYSSLLLGAGRTVGHPSFAQLALPTHAVVVEVWPEEQAELDNGLLLPLTELSFLDTGEDWRPVEEFESYLISSHGKIISLRYQRTNRQRLLCALKPGTYPSVVLSKAGITRQSGVNRLVAQTFLPLPEAHLTMLMPLDGNPLNLRATNLRWVDPHEREDASVLNYLHCCGARHPTSKLTAAQISLIRQQLAAGYSQQLVAHAFGVSRPTISLIATGKAWRLSPEVVG